MEEADPLKDPVLNYISDMMEEEVTEDRTCMFIDCSSYQAMAQELTDLITDSSSPGDSSHSEDSSHNDNGFFDERHSAASNNDERHSATWINDAIKVLPAPPAFHMKRDALESPTSVTSSTSSTVANGGCPMSAGKELHCPTRFKEDLLDSDEEIIRFIQEKAAAQESNGGHSKKAHTSDTASEECAQKILGLYPCMEHGAIGKKKSEMEDQCPAWDDRSMEVVRQNSAAKVEEIPEELEKRLAQEKENRIVLTGMLVDCAKAIAADDITKAYKLVNEVREKVSVYGDSAQRLGSQFVEALAARITGTGGLLYSAMSNNRPSAAEMLKAYYIIACHHPYTKMTHFFFNQSILDACEGAGRVHIVDFGILYGFQWPCLIKALGSRAGGPPHLRITGIDFPQPGFKPAERVEETGRRLAGFAKAWNVPFEYQAIATSWENVQPSALFLRHDDVLVVNCAFRLRHLLDETVKAESPRKVVLNRIRSMNPKVFVMGVVNGCYNSPFFVTRFSEALSYFGSIFEAFDSSISRDHPERLLLEQQIFGREILNAVACEGVERVERAESYKQWESRTLKAGFEQIPLKPEIYNKCRAMLSLFHKDHGVGQDGKWLLLGWKDRVIKAMATWRPR
ncbi:hypothetical protein O6H91_12G077000 [Diphasiastrum complanatum]|nr:hypothetical protein O6H91_12G077000 [Diphasiastrum complanatum]